MQAGINLLIQLLLLAGMTGTSTNGKSTSDRLASGGSISSSTTGNSESKAKAKAMPILECDADCAKAKAKAKALLLMEQEVSQKHAPYTARVVAEAMLKNKPLIVFVGVEPIEGEWISCAEATFPEVKAPCAVVAMPSKTCLSWVATLQSPINARKIYQAINVPQVEAPARHPFLSEECIDCQKGKPRQ